MKSQSILGSIRARVHPEHIRRLTVIDTEDYSGVVRKSAELLESQGVIVTSEYLERAVFALKQYYAIAMLDPANAHAVSSVVDPFWHSHILHTEQYMKFCDRVVGEYMHHIPLNKGNVGEIEHIRSLYKYTLDVLPRLFYEVDPVMWPRSDTSDAVLICKHKGNQDIYRDLQGIRLFAPIELGVPVVM